MGTLDRLGTDLPNWNKYYPIEQHYLRNTPNITASASKIVEVYHTFCTGRAALIFTDCDDYGQIVPKDSTISMLYFKSILAHQALSSYNICVDLSWQVVWLYLENTSLDLLYKKNEFERSIERCNKDSLEYKLVLAKKYKLRDYINAFFNDKLTQTIRRKYNYYKHRGAFYIPGLGENYKNLSLGFNDLDLKCFYREEFEVDEWINNLIEFHHRFHTYFENIINFMIPMDYLDGKKNEISEFIGYGMTVEEYLKNN